MKFETRVNHRRHDTAAFTLAEVLAAMMLLAIVIPAAIEALHVAGTAGTVAARKVEAARVAERILNENIIMASWNQANQSGTVMVNGKEFHWALRNGLWPADAMQLLTAEVTFTAQDRSYLVRLSTLVNAQQ
jgi:type II secretory pathway pseudopilin PulG